MCSFILTYNWTEQKQKFLFVLFFIWKCQSEYGFGELEKHYNNMIYMNNPNATKQKFWSEVSFFFFYLKSTTILFSF